MFDCSARSSAFTVQAAASVLPDLIIESVALQPASGVPGSRFDCIYVVRNIGQAWAYDFVVEVYLSPTSDPSNGVRVGSMQQAGLDFAPGYNFRNSTLVGLTVPSTPVGQQYVIVVANYAFAEANSSNNRFVTTFQVR